MAARLHHRRLGLHTATYGVEYNVAEQQKRVQQDAERIAI